MIQWSALKMILPVGMDWSGQKNSTLPGQTLVVLSTHSACLVVISTRRCVPSSQLWTSKIILQQIALIVLNIVPISILPKEHPQFLDDKQIQSCNLGSWKTENFITFKWIWSFTMVQSLYLIFTASAGTQRVCRFNTCSTRLCLGGFGKCQSDSQ